MQTIETVRSEEDYRAKLQRALDQELSRAAAGLTPTVSTKAAAQFLGIHFDTLGEWRRRSPPLGPPFQKGAGSLQGGANQHVRYLYEDLVEWQRARLGCSAKERRLRAELERLSQQQRELELERQIHEAKAALEKLRKNAGRFAALMTSHEGWAISHPWAVVGGLIAGHALTVDEDTLDRALTDGEIWDTTLPNALLEPWISVEARDPFDDAMNASLSAFQGAQAHARNQDRARGLEDRLPSPTAPEGTRKPFRF